MHVYQKMAIAAGDPGIPAMAGPETPTTQVTGLYHEIAPSSSILAIDCMVFVWRHNAITGLFICRFLILFLEGDQL